MLEALTIKDIKRRIGLWCKVKRIEDGISQVDLAQALDMSRITIQQLEAGKNVTLDTLLKVANHFNGLPAIYRLFKYGEEDANPDSLY